MTGSAPITCDRAGPRRPDDLDRLADTLTLFGALLTRELDPPLLAVLADPEVRDGFERAAPGAAAAITRPRDEADVEADAAEYARLFVVPGGVSPRASAWLASAVDGGPAAIGARVRAYEDALGAERSEELRSLPDDHAALGLLLTAAALRGDEGSRAAARQLFEELLVPWLLAFGEALEAAARDPVYRALGALLAALPAAFAEA